MLLLHRAATRRRWRAAKSIVNSYGLNLYSSSQTISPATASRRNAMASRFSVSCAMRPTMRIRVHMTRNAARHHGKPGALAYSALFDDFKQLTRRGEKRQHLRRTIASIPSRGLIKINAPRNGIHAQRIAHPVCGASVSWVTSSYLCAYFLDIVAPALNYRRAPQPRLPVCTYAAGIASHSPLSPLHLRAENIASRINIARARRGVAYTRSLRASSWRATRFWQGDINCSYSHSLTRRWAECDSSWPSRLSRCSPVTDRLSPRVQFAPNLPACYSRDARGRTAASKGRGKQPAEQTLFSTLFVVRWRDGARRALDVGKRGLWLFCVWFVYKTPCSYATYLVCRTIRSFVSLRRVP